MPTVLSLGQPATAFQFAYMLYLYGLPLLLWAAFAFCVLEHDAAQADWFYGMLGLLFGSGR